jgi:hypothetical protein
MLKVLLSELHPTQLSVGYEQVNEKITKMRKTDKIEHYLNDHIVPIILGPHNSMYIIDHHHFCLAAHKLNFKSVYGTIIKDWSDITNHDTFWKLMEEHKYVWLYNKLGHNIRLPEFLELLPISIKDLYDDPYRSLAGIIRKNGGFDKDTTPFAEFHWSNYFRNKIPDVTLNENTIKYALYLSSIKDAEHLPGFIMKK